AAGSGAGSLDVAARLPIINEPVRDLESNRVVGALTLAPRPTALWPRDVFAPSFGRSGYAAIIDRPSNRVILQTTSTPGLVSAHDLLGATWSKDSARLSRGSG